MAIETKPWTHDELARLPDDGNRYEVLDGELLVTPQAVPWHQGVAFRLTVLLHAYVERLGIGTALCPGAVVFSKNELQPDVQVIPVMGNQLRGLQWQDLPLPLLVVEVLSEGSRRHDLIKKRDAYLRIGIPEYWVVDHEERRVFIFTDRVSEPRVEQQVVEWRARSGDTPLSIDLRDLLA